jgi:hypothetical protein
MSHTEAKALAAEINRYAHWAVQIVRYQIAPRRYLYGIAGTYGSVWQQFNGPAEWAAVPAKKKVLR